MNTNMHDPMNESQAIQAEVEAQRAHILSAAGDELTRSTARRKAVRRNTLLAIVAVLISIPLLPYLKTEVLSPSTRVLATRQPSTSPLSTPRVAFTSIASSPAKLDFAVISSGPRLTVTKICDEEVEAALADSGHCSRLFRIGTSVRLVDCSTGLPYVIR
jgi:hypothetical protein